MKRLKMKELERLTGVGRETIRFYIREGLLPEPERPGRNVAWYDQSFVDRIGLIKELKQKRFLPLQVIRALVGVEATPSRDEMRTLIELDGKLFPALEGTLDSAPEQVATVAKRTGIKAKDIRRFAGVGLFEIVERDGQAWLDETGVRIVEVLARMHEVGFTEKRGFGPDKYRMYVDFVDWLTRQELANFTRGVTGKVGRDETVTMAEAGIVHVNQLLSLMRRATLLRRIAEASGARGSPVAGKRAGVPSRASRGVALRRRGGADADLGRFD